MCDPSKSQRQVGRKKQPTIVFLLDVKLENEDTIAEQAKQLSFLVTTLFLPPAVKSPATP